MIFQK